jgi:hypothetical protein
MLAMRTKAELCRKYFEEKQTLGKLSLFDEKGCLVFECKTLELPWRNNEYRKSRIPSGTYEVIPRKSPRFNEHYHVKNVVGRSYILIHSGNYNTDTAGCILVGRRHTDINGDGMRDVTSSRNTLNELLELAPNGFELEIC